MSMFLSILTFMVFEFLGQHNYEILNTRQLKHACILSTGTRKYYPLPIFIEICIWYSSKTHQDPQRPLTPWPVIIIYFVNKNLFWKSTNQNRKLREIFHSYSSIMLMKKWLQSKSHFYAEQQIRHQLTCIQFFRLLLQFLPQ